MLTTGCKTCTPPTVCQSLSFTSVPTSRSCISMSFSPSFGGFGDFVSVVIIIRNLYGALSEGSGSAREYQDIKDELDDVADLVQKYIKFIATGYLSPEHVRSVERQIGRWSVKFQQHEKCIRNYPALAEVSITTPPSRRQQIWRKIQMIKWRLVNTKDVTKIRDDINSFRLSFTAHTNLANL